MELTNLSSNWKKLQQTLPSKSTSKANPKDSAVPTVLGKRKHTADDSRVAQKNKSIVREKRPHDSQYQTTSREKAPRTHSAAKPDRRKSMGLLSSKPALDCAAAIVDALPTTNGAAIEDIPASQLSLTRKPSSASVRSYKDSINSGIVPSVSVGKYVSIDCEMVGVGPNPDNSSVLARVSMVNYHGEQVYDSFVTPKEAVTDYRTYVSGITPKLLETARSFEQVQEDVAALLDGRILVGHAIRHDLKVLMLGHPMRDIRDTSRHKQYREISNGRTPGLKRLAREVLGVEIQAGEHSSIEDARATMMLYKREKNNFEREHVRKFGVDRRQTRPEAIEGEVVAVKKQGTEGSGKGKGGKKKKRKR